MVLSLCAPPFFFALFVAATRQQNLRHTIILPTAHVLQEAPEEAQGRVQPRHAEIIGQTCRLSAASYSTVCFSKVWPSRPFAFFCFCCERCSSSSSCPRCK